MKGVISASVSAGSSQRVARVTCTPNDMVPLGSAPAGVANQKRSVTKTRRIREARLGFMGAVQRSRASEFGSGRVKHGRVLTVSAGPAQYRGYEDLDSAIHQPRRG